MTKTQLTWDLPNLAGQTWLVTGATSGIGLDIIRIAYRCGAKIIFTSRNEKKTQKVINDIPSATPIILELGDLDSVREAAKQTPEIDVLVNNAGVQTKEQKYTKDGFEQNIGVNFLGPFLYTNLILEKIKRRVVICGSIAHRRGHIDLDDPHFRHRQWGQSTAYSQSKLADMLWAFELSERLGAKGSEVDVQLFHPGWVPTKLGTNFNSKIISKLAPIIGQDTRRGALPAIYAGSLDLPPCTYIGPTELFGIRGKTGICVPSDDALDRSMAKKLWEFAEKETSQKTAG